MKLCWGGAGTKCCRDTSSDRSSVKLDCQVNAVIQHQVAVHEKLRLPIITLQRKIVFRFRRATASSTIARSGGARLSPTSTLRQFTGTFTCHHGALAWPCMCRSSFLCRGARQRVWMPPGVAMRLAFVHEFAVAAALPLVRFHSRPSFPRTARSADTCRLVMAVSASTAATPVAVVTPVASTTTASSSTSCTSRCAVLAASCRVLVAVRVRNVGVELRCLRCACAVTCRTHP